MNKRSFRGLISLFVISALILIIHSNGFAREVKKRGPHVEGGASGEEFIKLFDTDKDGKISHDEWEAVKPNTVFKKKRWPMYDLNRDRAITLDEAPRTEDGSEPAPPEEKKQTVSANQIAFIVKFDKNKDGKLDNTEFTGQHFTVYDKNGDGYVEMHEAPEGETAY